MDNRYPYQTYTVPCKEKRLLLVTDVHNCHIDWYQTTAEDRLAFLCDCFHAHYERQPYDVILSLGDYSLDFWKYNEGGSYLWDPPVSRTDAFVKSYVPQMPTEFFMIPGNHEQYSRDDWQKITGRPREYAVIYGDYVFAMLDTFSGQLDPKENHDGSYTGINTAFLSAVLHDHPEKTVILCAHDLIPSMEGEAARTLICENPRIICAFTGHTHRDNTLLLPVSWRSFPVFYCGDFSYNSGREQNKNWGYRLLDLTDDTLSTEYIRV